ncbi:MAG: tRNA (adenosine(37)-N6)-dimethylallyltransferase MiaA [Treponema sp.]|jgi:tRNA dimethylallyltransferase|nr:tRNA (adenosine(37)-N6)-dimethylallyltransferase MiaA [Treponema sp.]
MPEGEAVPLFQAVILFGPTASGKTEILEELFEGGAFPRPPELISADSMQVYRGMDIGTAKPSPRLRSLFPHHLIDIRNPGEQFNAGEFVRLADEAVREISGRGALPVISGGTGFYLKNFINGLPEAPPSDGQIRAALREELRLKGAAALAEELAACDPVSAGRIHLHDEYRLLRALEVFRLSGRPLSSYRASGAGPEARGHYRFLIIGLKRSREELYRRINERCAAMFRSGLPAEVLKLRNAGYGPRDPGMRAIGYREFFVESSGGGPSLSPDLPAVEALIARNSRRYAKRQLLYFASIPGVIWISAEDNPAARIRRELAEFFRPPL